MSGFFRPEVIRALQKYREPLAGGALALFGLFTLWRGLQRYDLMVEMIGVVLLALGLALTYVGYRRAQFALDPDGPGVVELREQQIVYLSAAGGGSIDIAALSRLELRSVHSFGRVWVLKQSGAPSLMIPVNAAGAEALFDAFQALPGLSSGALVAALKAKDVSRQIVWRGAPGFRALT